MKRIGLEISADELITMLALMNHLIDTKPGIVKSIFSVTDRPEEAWEEFEHFRSKLQAAMWENLNELNEHAKTRVDPSQVNPKPTKWNI